MRILPGPAHDTNIPSIRITNSLVVYLRQFMKLKERHNKNKKEQKLNKVDWMEGKVTSIDPIKD